MKTVQAIYETYLMYVCFFALAMIVGVFTLTYCWKQLRRIFSLGSIQGIFVSLIVVFLTLYGGSKSRFYFENGLKNDGSYSTNDIVYLSWVKSGTVPLLPNTSKLYVEKKISDDTNSIFTVFYTNIVGIYELTLNVPNATNYDYNVWYEYIPDQEVHTNGTWMYYAKHSIGENKTDIIPNKAIVQGSEGKSIIDYTPYPYTATNYVQNGLIAIWDGIENDGYRSHSASITNWASLNGNNKISSLSSKSRSWFTTNAYNYFSINNNNITFLGALNDSAANADSFNGIFSKNSMLTNKTDITFEVCLISTTNHLDLYNSDGSLSSYTDRNVNLLLGDGTNGNGGLYWPIGIDMDHFGSNISYRAKNNGTWFMPIAENLQIGTFQTRTVTLKYVDKDTTICNVYIDGKKKVNNIPLETIEYIPSFANYLRIVVWDHTYVNPSYNNIWNSDMTIYSIRVYDRVLSDGEIAKNSKIDDKRFRPKPSARDYIQDGLVAMWDGIENAGWGKHDDNATEWVDLVNGVSLKPRYGMGLRTAMMGTTQVWTKVEWKDNAFYLSQNASRHGAYNSSDFTKANFAQIGFNDANISNHTVEVAGRWSITAEDGSADLNPNGANFRFTSLAGVAYVRSLYYNWGLEWWVFNGRQTTLNYIPKTDNGKLFCQSFAHDDTTAYSWYNGVCDGYHTGVFPPTETKSIGAGIKTFTWFDIGNYGCMRQWIYCQRIYNRKLTDEEVKHNYEVDKARFGTAVDAAE